MLSGENADKELRETEDDNCKKRMLYDAWIEVNKNNLLSCAVPPLFYMFLLPSLQQRTVTECNIFLFLEYNENPLIMTKQKCPF